MAQEPTVPVTEEERAEFERVVGALAKWPRLSHLLQYMGKKLFAGEFDQLNEYNIATDVLGRSKTVFNAGEDAIARVETHRLRKRLADYYANEGKERFIQVSLPAGSYVPVFIHRNAESATDPTAFVQRFGSDSHSGRGPGLFRIPSRWRYLFFAAGLILFASLAYLYFHTWTVPEQVKSEDKSLPAAAPSPARDNPASTTVRLLAGYSGPPRTDSAGNIWYPDKFFTLGGSWQRAPGFIARTSDPFLFEHSRTGDFNYAIPLKQGVYELHLLFSTPTSDAIATFNVAVNGEFVLQGFDINQDALGNDVGDERVFRDVSPGKDGLLQLNFSGALTPPTLNAIEILPGVPHAQLPIRLIMQTTPFTDRKGKFWRPDNYFMNGRLSVQAHPLVNSPDPELFAGERFGHFTYAIPVDTRDTYTLNLYFTEPYFGTGAPGGGGIGNRVFKVMCNGETLLNDFDILKESGGPLRAVTKTFRHLKPSAQGKLNLIFEPIANNATVSAIEVLDESR